MMSSIGAHYDRGVRGNTLDRTPSALNCCVPSVLICATDALSEELRGTLVWRDDMSRHVASRFQEALVAAVAERPDLIVVDSALAEADRLVSDLRLEAATATVSIAVFARPDEPSDTRFLDAGANAVLRLPAGPEWDEKLGPLLLISGRRATRIPVELELQASAGQDAPRLNGTVLNVSETGMLLEADVALPLDVDLQFRIRLDDRMDPVVGKARVVRRDGHHCRGVRFVKLEGDGLTRLRQLVELSNVF
jgi:hypothetical protein